MRKREGDSKFSVAKRREGGREAGRVRGREAFVEWFKEGEAF